MTKSTKTTITLVALILSLTLVMFWSGPKAVAGFNTLTEYITAKNNISTLKNPEVVTAALAEAQSQGGALNSKYTTLNKNEVSKKILQAAEEGGAGVSEINIYTGSPKTVVTAWGPVNLVVTDVTIVTDDVAKMLSVLANQNLGGRQLSVEGNTITLQYYTLV